MSDKHLKGQNKETGREGPYTHNSVDTTSFSDTTLAFSASTDAGDTSANAGDTSANSGDRSNTNDADITDSSDKPNPKYSEEHFTNKTVQDLLSTLNEQQIELLALGSDFFTKLQHFTTDENIAAVLNIPKKTDKDNSEHASDFPEVDPTPNSNETERREAYLNFGKAFIVLLFAEAERLGLVEELTTSLDVLFEYFEPSNE
ncbi:uncharacterized protein SPAPADRAFT_68432 [Spathaspora passalidarum NRRL Y-27907]|uniref:Uncharacterized protein n=1 Tax=Spathaspora passalidarum (strain NRRL Y-27907 / 11-Y1) TaxID=619300 RepID=G3ATU1_SPAPN|nr:uncharacterized protein SPAPADRAFT_68432 [Spathaspora passalidarum NRRL Y-27907]EGW30317.1 hypothetical protein SPAPADRAFT_68432 [Spathaspora passalidarum NRRL Y-27907]